MQGYCGWPQAAMPLNLPSSTIYTLRATVGARLWVARRHDNEPLSPRAVHTQSVVSIVIVKNLICTPNSITCSHQILDKFPNCTNEGEGGRL